MANEIIASALSRDLPCFHLYIPPIATHVAILKCKPNPSQARCQHTRLASLCFTLPHFASLYALVCQSCPASRVQSIQIRRVLLQSMMVLT